jgi:hypothetical protein
MVDSNRRTVRNGSVYTGERKDETQRREVLSYQRLLIRTKLCSRSGFCSTSTNLNRWQRHLGQWLKGGGRDASAPLSIFWVLVATPSTEVLSGCIVMNGG